MVHSILYCTRSESGEHVMPNSFFVLFYLQDQNSVSTFILNQANALHYNEQCTIFTAPFTLCIHISILMVSGWEKQCNLIYQDRYFSLFLVLPLWPPSLWADTFGKVPRSQIWVDSRWPGIGSFFENDYLK